MKNAYFLVLPQVHLLDLAGPLQIVRTLPELGLADVRLHLVGPADTVRAYQEATLARLAPLPERLGPDSAVFVIGSRLEDALLSSEAWRRAAAWLRRQADGRAPGLQVCGVCTGSFLLADAGLLAGRRCTTHHRFVDRLQRRCPEAHVAGNRTHVQDGPTWTSAGVSTGIDLALQLIAHRFGDEIALQVARENVVTFRRFGGDAELSPMLRHRAHGNEIVHAVQDHLARHLAERTDPEALAGRFGYSGRHLARLFVAEAGITMKRFQTELRIDLARRLLADTSLSLERIAERCGFGSVQAFRANWNQLEPSPPSAARGARTAGPTRFSAPEPTALAGDAAPVPPSPPARRPGPRAR